jgi:hypothetical protein
MSSLASNAMDLLVKPGASLRLVPAINVSVLLLLGILASLLWNEIAKIHIVVMSGLAIGLLASVNWVYYEYEKAVAAGEVQGDTNGPKGPASKKSD